MRLTRKPLFPGRLPRSSAAAHLNPISAGSRSVAASLPESAAADRADRLTMRHSVGSDYPTLCIPHSAAPLIVAFTGDHVVAQSMPGAQAVHAIKKCCGRWLPLSQSPDLYRKPSRGVRRILTLQLAHDRSGAEICQARRRPGQIKLLGRCEFSKPLPKPASAGDRVRALVTGLTIIPLRVCRGSRYRLSRLLRLSEQSAKDDIRTDPTPFLPAAPESARYASYHPRRR